MTTRRSMVFSLAAGLAATGGCFGFATGTAPLEARAEAVTVADGALAETGYEVSRSERVEETYAVRIAGRSRTIEASNYVSEYRKRLSIGAVEEEYLGALGVASAPRTELFGRTFHPFEGASARQLATDLQSEYDGFEDVEPAGTDAIPILDGRRQVTVLRASAEQTGESLDVTLRVVAFDHRGDRLVGAGIHPTGLSGERQRIRTLLKRIEYG